MITIVCLSPSLDETITLDRLIPGGTNRVQDRRVCAGGKGVNVARNLAAMGEHVRLAVFRHAQGAQLLFHSLDEAGVECLPVDVPGALRVNIKLLDTSCDTVTEVNAAAQPVPQEAIAQMEAVIAASAAKSRWLVLTGSLPKGYPADAYARVIRCVRATAPQCRIALDAEGEPLRLGVQEGPDLIKPNRHELELLTGKELQARAQVLAAAKALHDGGVGEVLVSLDTDGSLLVSAQRAYSAGAICVPVATTVGAGDALLSGYLHAREQGECAALAYGTACAAASVAGRREEVQALVPQAAVQPIG